MRDTQSWHSPGAPASLSGSIVLRRSGAALGRCTEIDDREMHVLYCTMYSADRAWQPQMQCAMWQPPAPLNPRCASVVSPKSDLSDSQHSTERSSSVLRGPVTCKRKTGAELGEFKGNQPLALGPLIQSRCRDG